MKICHLVKAAFALLRSSQRGTFLIFCYKVFAIITSPLDRLATIVFPSIQKVSRRKGIEGQQMIFVVGLHRSGATYAAQRIQFVLQAKAIGNWCSFAPKLTLIITYYFLRNIMPRSIPKVSRNFYGQTPQIYSVSDCNEFYDNWFGINRQTVPNKIDLGRLLPKMRVYLDIASLLGTPTYLVLKNGRFSLMLRELYQAFPNAHFVIVQRDYEAIIRSAERASVELGGINDFWGMHPNGWPQSHFDLKKTHIRDAVEACRNLLAKDCLYLNDRMARITYIDYEDLCRITDDQLRSILATS